MTVWNLNGRFNWVEREDCVQFVAATPRWTMTKVKSGELLAKGTMGDVVVLNFKKLKPGECLTIFDENDTPSTYCVKYPPEVIGEIESVEDLVACR